MPLDENAVPPPGLSVFSSNSTRAPFLAATSAAMSPHPPAPMTMISGSTFCMYPPKNTGYDEDFYYVRETETSRTQPMAGSWQTMTRRDCLSAGSRFTLLGAGSRRLRGKVLVCSVII